jgi:curved DNA-binding protein CbpA
LTTHYAILGVSHSATPEHIRRAYRALAKSLHPDVNKDADATARFAKVTVAYDTLSDPNKRREYDRSLLREQERSRPVDTRAHYTWTNIAAHDSDKAREANRQEELDELYDTFFTSPASRPSPAKAEPRSKPSSSSSGRKNQPRKR